MKSKPKTGYKVTRNLILTINGDNSQVYQDQCCYYIDQKPDSPQSASVHRYYSETKMENTTLKAGEEKNILATLT